MYRSDRQNGWPASGSSRPHKFLTDDLSLDGAAAHTAVAVINR
jgi:hypothetical protein